MLCNLVVIDYISLICSCNNWWNESPVYRMFLRAAQRCADDCVKLQCVEVYIPVEQRQDRHEHIN